MDETLIVFQDSFFLRTNRFDGKHLTHFCLVLLECKVTYIALLFLLRDLETRGRKSGRTNH